MIESGEQRMSYWATEEVIVDDDGRRWVREGAATLPSWAVGVPVPRDKDGNVVPLATRRLYDGKGYEHEVKEIALVDSKLSGGLVWRVKDADGPILTLSLLHIERPDTWERLEEDIESMSRGVSICNYFGHGQDISCSACPVKNLEEPCFVKVARDVFRRSKALAGRDAND